MGFSLRRWRPIHLLGSWVVYWIALATVALTPAVGAVRRLASSPENRGTVDFGYDDGQLHLKVVESGETLYTGHASLLTTTLLIAGPPLLLWLVWLLTRPKRGAAEAAERAALGEGPWQGVPEDADAVRSGVRRPPEREG